MSRDLLQIPFATSGSWFAQPIQLAGQDVVLEFQYNERASLWYMDILDAAETPIVQGIALRCRRDLLRNYRTKVFPDSLMFVYDSTGRGADPVFDSFALTHRLYFVAGP